MKRNMCFLSIVALIILSSSPILCQTEVSGNIISATWTSANSPYIVTGDVMVVALTIEPGVIIRFNGDYVFEVVGSLFAQGDEQNPILFTKNSSDIRWGGIYINAAQSVSLKFCRIEWSCDSGIHVRSSTAAIQSCRIIYNYVITEGMPSSPGKGSGIYIENNSSVQINNCLIDSNLVTCNYYYNRGGAVYAEGENSETTMKNCIIANNEASVYPGHSDGGGIYLENGGNFIIENCVITGTFVDAPGVVNGGGLFLAYPGPDQLTIRNSIIFKNGDNSFCFDFGLMDSSCVNATYSCIDYGYPGIGNISSNPLFLDAQFHLIAGFSPCIDSGDQNSIYNDPQDDSNPGCALFPAMGTIRNDMGAYGGPGSSLWPLIVDAPEFNPLPGQYDDVQNITIHCNTADAVLYYTIDGSDPTESDSVYTNPIRISTSSILKARAYKTGWNPSNISTGSYIITNTFVKITGSNVPAEFSLMQNYPNPFNPCTTIVYQLPEDSHVTLRINNIMGKEIITLINDIEKTGCYEVGWDGSDQNGIEMPSGLYFCQIKTDKLVKSIKMILNR